MSLDLQQPTYRITFRDANGDSSSIRGWFPKTWNEATAMAAVAGLANTLSGISGAVVVHYSVTYPYKDLAISGRSNLSVIPVLSRYIFQLSSDSTLHESILAPFDVSWVETSGPLAGIALDVTNSDLLAFTGVISSDGWCNEFGDDIGDVESAHLEETV